MDAQPVSDRFQLRHAATGRVLEVNVPPRRLFAIDGFGPIDTAAFELALRTLRLADHEVRAALAARSQRSPTPAAECLWRPGPAVEPADLVRSFVSRAEWRWQLLVEIPAAADDAEARAAIDGVRGAAGRDRPLIGLLDLRESEALQVLSVGGAATEADALRRLLDAAAGQGREPDGAVHQIFVTDPARSNRDRRRSILRIPVVAAERARPDA